MFNPFKKKRFEIDDFAKLVITEAKKAGIAESFEYDPKTFVLKRGDQRTYLVNLFNDYNDVERAKKVSALFYYEQQTETLMKLYEQKGKDLFVANYTLNQLETGGYESVCAWSKTVPTLKCDFGGNICFGHLPRCRSSQSDSSKRENQVVMDNASSASF